MRSIPFVEGSVTKYGCEILRRWKTKAWTARQFWIMVKDIEAWTPNSFNSKPWYYKMLSQSLFFLYSRIGLMKSCPTVRNYSTHTAASNTLLTIERSNSFTRVIISVGISPTPLEITIHGVTATATKRLNYREANRISVFWENKTHKGLLLHLPQVISFSHRRTSTAIHPTENLYLAMPFTQ